VVLVLGLHRANRNVVILTKGKKMDNIKAYLIGAAIGVTVYIVAKNFGFEMIITI
jgi:hypothetical protein